MSYCLRIVDLGAISCAHKIPWHNGKCKELHGHNYKVKMYVLAECDIWIDFIDLKKLGKEVIDKYDHKNISDEFGIYSAEEFVKKIYEEIINNIRIKFKDIIKKVYIILFETDNFGVAYPYDFKNM
jgi:6-pyruvoyltetrahydropterin/6-carboxytetrahydropterin synthase